jgi:Anaphase-promoting complex, cyclosome, subunit 3
MSDDTQVESMKSPTQYADFVSEELIFSYRNVVKSYYEKVCLSMLVNAREFLNFKSFQHLYKSAAFWADKIMCITQDPQDIYWHAQCLYHLKEFQRAAHIITSQKLHKV